MSFLNTITNYPTNLIIGGGYISQYHIRASLSNNFVVKVIEIDKYKRRYLEYLFPEIIIYKSLKDFLEENSISDIDLLSILIPKQYRQSLYQSLPKLNCKVLIEKPLTSLCTKKFNHKNSFLCLNQSYNRSGYLLISNYFHNKFITKIISNRPDPNKLLRQNNYEEYLLDYLPHTLTPVHLIKYKQNPSIKINTITKNKISGKYLIKENNIDFEVNLNDKNFDTYLYLDENVFSYDNSLIKINSSFFNFRRNIQMLRSIVKNQWGYSTMYKLYKEIKFYKQSSKNKNLIDKLLLSNCLYLAEENYV